MTRRTRANGTAARRGTRRKSQCFIPCDKQGSCSSTTKRKEMIPDVGGGWAKNMIELVVKNRERYSPGACAPYCCDYERIRSKVSRPYELVKGSRVQTQGYLVSTSLYHGSGGTGNISNSVVSSQAYRDFGGSPKVSYTRRPLSR